MTNTDQIHPNPAEILLAKTGCATPGELTALMANRQQEILNLQKYNQILYTQCQPFVEKAEHHERRALSLGFVGLTLASATPIGVLFLGAAAVEVVKGSPSRAAANRLLSSIAHNTGEIDLDTNFIQQGQQALAEAQSVAVALQVAQTARLQSPGMC